MQAGDDEFAAWFRLLETPGLGREGARRLLAALGSPDAILSAPPATLRQLLPAALADALRQPPPSLEERLAAAIAWQHGGDGRGVIALGDADYPPQLLQAPDPPLLLYWQGSVAALAAPSLAVVGSRQPTAQGADHARAFALALSQAGLVVASGLAAGIDAAAHEGALNGPSATIAVVGTGLDRVYPARHHKLAHRIAAQGVLLSEYTPGTPPLAENFPQRNRLIAGLSLGTLVVEAALRSGSLITARLAAEAGREVFAIPGSIHSAQSRGCHALIKQGAQLVESAADILDALGASPARPAAATDPAAPPPGTHDGDDPLLRALGEDPATLDVLLARTGLAVEEAGARLLELELLGQVARLPGGLYQRRHLA